uniref:ATP synthase F0 subunit 8 n=1 Tax=Exitianus nanus TaxID=1401695 RepID=UPI0021D536CB|nr:ATP synthase F0 subunit 8 [Exitianus nanus]UXD78655.1 ATP synthase F0 subunit 8 [Exitianus nanus]
MPQMSPMWWTTISVMSICSMIIMISFTYFLFNNKLKMNMKTKNIKFNWKW